MYQFAWKRGPASLPAKVEFFLPWYCRKIWDGIFNTDSVTLSSTRSICSLKSNITSSYYCLIFGLSYSFPEKLFWSQSILTTPMGKCRLFKEGKLKVQYSILLLLHRSSAKNIEGHSKDNPTTSFLMLTSRDKGWISSHFRHRKAIQTSLGKYKYI